MPEASVDQHDRLVFWENNIGLRGEMVGVKPESKPFAVEKPSHNNFGLRIPTTNARHHSAACRYVYDISQPSYAD